MEEYYDKSCDVGKHEGRKGEDSLEVGITI